MPPIVKEGGEVKLRAVPSARRAASQRDPRSRYMRERGALRRAMMASPAHAKANECDFVPGMELIGMYITHATVSRMVARGELSMACGAYLNAAIALHAFICLHACTHGAVAGHNAEHAAFESTVYRLATVLVFFDDGYLISHRQHHRHTNTAQDPDLGHATASLEDLGKGLRAQAYVPRGMLAEADPMFSWHFQVLREASLDAISFMRSRPEYAALGNVLRGTWRGSASIASFLLILFFARYPHRNGADPNEVDSFYDGNFRGQGQVDLWMMGEGWHHGHHAKNDVNYTVLPRVGAEVEARHPHIRRAFRGNDNLRQLESDGALPPPLSADAAPPGQEAWERTLAVRRALGALLGGDTPRGVAGAAAAVAENALRVTAAADRGLLRELQRKMGLRGAAEDAAHPLPMSGWHRSVFAEDTAAELAAAAGRIKTEVAAVAARVAARAPRVSTAAELKSSYLGFFTAIKDALVDPAAQEAFIRRRAPGLPPPAAPTISGGAGAALSRLRAFLESPIPHRVEDGAVPEVGRGAQRDARQRIADLFVPLAAPAPRPRL